MVSLVFILKFLLEETLVDNLNGFVEVLFVDAQHNGNLGSTFVNHRNIDVFLS